MSKSNAEIFQRIEAQVQHSNAELFGLINGIHAMVSRSSQNAVLPEPMILDDQDTMPAPDVGYRELSVQANFANSSSINPTPLQPRRRQSPTLTPQSYRAFAPPLSTDLLEINRSRSAIGREQYMLFRRQNATSDAVPGLESEREPNSFFRVDQPTVSQAAMELEQIVFKLSSRSKRTRTPNEIATQQLHRWLQGCEAIINSWPSTAAATKVDKQRQQKDGHALMVNLNSTLSQANSSVKQQIYEALDRNGIDRIFERLRDRLHSVMVEKEIQIYEDEKESLE